MENYWKSYNEKDKSILDSIVIEINGIKVTGKNLTPKIIDDETIYGEIALEYGGVIESPDGSVKVVPPNTIVRIASETSEYIMDYSCVTLGSKPTE